MRDRLRLWQLGWSTFKRVQTRLRTWLAYLTGNRRPRLSSAAIYEGERRTALRQVWEIGAEFSDHGWGRRDLDALRLLCLNLRFGQALGPRIAERLRRVLPPVLSSSVDRIRGLLDAARLLPVDPHTLLEIEAGLELLLSQLEGVACHAGSSLTFEPREVIGAIDRIQHGCHSVRLELEPLVTCELALLIRRLAEQHHAARLVTGELLLDLRDAHGAMVAIEPSDLARCLESLLAAMFHTEHRLSPVRVAAQPLDDALRLSVSWAPNERVPVDPSRLTRPLRALATYGVHHTLDENLESRTRRLSAWFPLAGSTTSAASTIAGQ